MITPESIEREEKEREEQFQKEIGAFGRVLDNAMYFCLLLTAICFGVSSFVFLVGLLHWMK